MTAEEDPPWFMAGEAALYAARIVIQEKDEEIQRLSEALESVRINHKPHTNSDICPICLALLWAEGLHPFQGDTTPGRGISGVTHL